MATFKNSSLLAQPSGLDSVGLFSNLTPIALAVRAQGDGCKHNNGFNLNTQSLTLQQVVILLNVLY